MSGVVVLVPLLIVLALISVVLLIGFVLAARTKAARTAGGVHQSGSGAEERAVRRIRLLGLLLAMVLGWWMLTRTTTLDELGVNLMLAPIAFGLCLLVFTVLGEVLVRPRFDEGPRTAQLRTRRVRDHLPRLLTPLVAFTLVAAIALCSFTLATASPDDMGRAGRTLFRFCSATRSAGSGPYPGSFYVLPYAIGVGAAALTAVAAMLRITHRAVGGTPAQGTRYRTVGIRAVVGAFGVALSAPLAGLAFFAATTLLGHDCAPPSWTAVGYAGLGVILLSLLTFAASVVSLLVSAPAPVPAVDQPAHV